MAEIEALNGDGPDPAAPGREYVEEQQIYNLNTENEFAEYVTRHSYDYDQDYDRIIGNENGNKEEKWREGNTRDWRWPGHAKVRKAEVPEDARPKKPPDKPTIELPCGPKVQTIQSKPMPGLLKENENKDQITGDQMAKIEKEPSKDIDPCKQELCRICRIDPCEKGMEWKTNGENRKTK